MNLTDEQVAQLKSLTDAVVTADAARDGAEVEADEADKALAVAEADALLKEATLVAAEAALKTAHADLLAYVQSLGV